jgi:hypothetical protein
LSLVLSSLHFLILIKQVNVTMGNEDKHSDTDAERQEHRISLEKDAAKLDMVSGADATQKALYAEFANKDEAWKNEMDKKLVRKIDGRLLPILVVLYLLNFLDRYVYPYLCYITILFHRGL